MSPLPVTPTPGRLTADRAHAAARLNLAVSWIPSPAWLATSAEALEVLQTTMRRVLAGSAWPEPDASMRDCKIGSSKLAEAASLLAAALHEVNSYARANGVGTVDMRTAGWHGQAVPPVPPLPKTNTLRDVAQFIQGCLYPLDPAGFTAAVTQLPRARAALINGISTPAPGSPPAETGGLAPRPTSAGGLGHCPHLNKACGLLNQAQEPLGIAAERIFASRHALSLYLKGTVGTPTNGKPKSDRDNPQTWREIKKAIQDAKRTEEEIKKSHERAKKVKPDVPDSPSISSDDGEHDGSKPVYPESDNTGKK